MTTVSMDNMFLKKSSIRTIKVHIVLTIMKELLNKKIGNSTAISSRVDNLRYVLSHVI